MMKSTYKKYQEMLKSHVGSRYVKLALLLAGDGADGTTMELAKVGALLRSSLEPSILVVSFTIFFSIVP